MHDEIVTLRQVLKTGVRHNWLSHLPDLSPPYKTQGKIVHRPWFSPAEYKQLYTATREYTQSCLPKYKWNAEQVHDFVLFLANTGLRPDEAKNLEHRDVAIVEDRSTVAFSKSKCAASAVWASARACPARCNRTSGC